MVARPQDPFWGRYSDEELGELRLCDLDVTIQGTVLEDRVHRLYAELARRDIRHRPHAWLSSEWFSPDGVPGIAIPFYLAHPRLMKLEKRNMLEVEGGRDRECMRLLRHEAACRVACNQEGPFGAVVSNPLQEVMDSGTTIHVSFAV